MSDKFNSEQLEEMKNAFALYDRDCDGLINVTELGVVMRSVGAIPTESDLRQLAQEFSKNGVTTVDYNTFLTHAARFFRGDSENDIKAAFRVFDKDGKGFVNSTELRHVLVSLGEKLTDSEADQFIREADPSNTGKITYDQFAKVLLMK